MNTKLMVTSLRNVALAGLYIFGVSQFMYYGEKIISGPDNNFMPFIFLMLFSLSAAVVGSLVFGQAVALFLDDKKKESMQSVIYSVLWLFVITAVAVTLFIIIK